MVPEMEHDLGLVNLKNYGPMADFVTQEIMTVNTDDITPDTWDTYFIGTLNIFRDGIEDPIIRSHKIRVVFGDTGISCKLFITDFFINVEMWNCIIYAGGKIKPCHLMKQTKGIQSGDIKKYIDKHFIRAFRGKLDFKLMNNIIDDTLFNWYFINEFSNYFADTLNLKDSVELCIKNPEYNALLHADLSQYGIDEINNAALDLTDRMMQIEQESKQILGYDHCMANSHRSGQSPRKQLKEGFIAIGPKPDGNGSVYSHPITTSYVNGGVNDIADFFVDSALARTAQILSHNDVGQSGHFARMLGLNNSGTFISDEVSKCNTHRLIKLTMKTMKHVEMYLDRYCKLIPNGVDILITEDNMNDFLGRDILIYSPITCNSKSHGKGVCKRCYGILELINHSINIGKMAAELLSQALTQKLLSAKHILEAAVKKIKWCAKFFDYFIAEYNYIMLKDPDLLKHGYIVIDPSEIDIDNQDDYNSDDPTGNISEHISSFKVVLKNGTEYEISDEDGRELYISNEMTGWIRKYGDDRDGLIYVPVDKMSADVPLFYIKLLNNELSRVLNALKSMINKKPITESYTIDGLLQLFIDTLLEGGLDIRGVHCEVVISNQIRDRFNDFESIDWRNPNAAYRLITLNDALLTNPSPAITLMYQNLAKTLYTPLTYRKNGPSFLDLFFMEHPQKFLNSKFAKTQYDSEFTERVPWTIYIPPLKPEDKT